MILPTCRTVLHEAVGLDVCRWKTWAWYLVSGVWPATIHPSRYISPLTSSSSSSDVRLSVCLLIVTYLSIHPSNCPRISHGYPISVQSNLLHTLSPIRHITSHYSTRKGSVGLREGMKEGKKTKQRATSLVSCRIQRRCTYYGLVYRPAGI
ncbi:hypothetical protein BZA05DRAFT_392847 [Tricharina praecox]|uniref:uncharacterized protein n=1 Tax=Tricharina praecox TaxID=43433 RepID=UPI0022212279|nr:uncharacterized protein BZA05DRAFT_392847 [Tricharina praecox]KAI5854878.1 hypothetical protein BZA05DRAFT_392847 [Tricharina praecox]